MWVMNVGGFGWHLFLTSLFWIIAIVLFGWLVSGLAFGAADDVSSSSVTAESALDILQQRYARGEISKTDYEMMRHDLEA